MSQRFLCCQPATLSRPQKRPCPANGHSGVCGDAVSLQVRKKVFSPARSFLLSTYDHLQHVPVYRASPADAAQKKPHSLAPPSIGRPEDFLPTPTPTLTTMRHAPMSMQLSPILTPPAEQALEPLTSEDVEMEYVWAGSSSPSPDEGAEKRTTNPPTPPTVERIRAPSSEPAPAAIKALKFRMGFVPDCPKCRDRIPGHYSHF